MKLLAVLSAALLLLALPVTSSHGQGTVDSPKDSKPQEKVADDGKFDDEDRGSGTDEAKNGSNNETEAEQSPFDYQSSEQISEDKSVSFPVDI